MRPVETSWKMKLWVVCQELPAAACFKHFHSFQRSSCRFRMGMCILCASFSGTWSAGMADGLGK